MHQLMYISRSITLLNTLDLTELLEQSKELNHVHGVTGVLMYQSASFIQLLEGEQAAVHATYARICKDPRHHRITTLIDKPATAREFTGWNMFCPQLDVPHAYRASELAQWIAPILSQTNNTNIAAHLIANFLKLAP